MPRPMPVMQKVKSHAAVFCGRKSYCSSLAHGEGGWRLEAAASPPLAALLAEVVVFDTAPVSTRRVPHLSAAALDTPRPWHASHAPAASSAVSSADRRPMRRATPLHAHLWERETTRCRE